MPGFSIRGVILDAAVSVNLADGTMGRGSGKLNITYSGATTHSGIK